MKEKTILFIFYVLSFIIILLYPFNEIPSITLRKLILPLFFIPMYIISRKRVFLFLFLSLETLQPASYVLNKIYSIGIEREDFTICNGDFCFVLSDLCSGWLEISGLIFLGVRRKRILTLIPVYITYNFIRIRLLFYSKSFLIHNVFWLPSLIFFLWILYLIIKE